jgi:hypothetical protein
VSTTHRPCPSCGSRCSRKIIWTNDLEKAGASPDPGVIFLAGSRRWNEVPGPNRVCSSCAQRFCADALQQERFDAETRRRFAPFEATMDAQTNLLPPQTPVGEIADALIRLLRL